MLRMPPELLAPRPLPASDRSIGEVRDEVRELAEIMEGARALTEEQARIAATTNEHIARLIEVIESGQRSADRVSRAAAFAGFGSLVLGAVVVLAPLLEAASRPAAVPVLAVVAIIAVGLTWVAACILWVALRARRAEP